MKMKRGTAASTSSLASPMVWKAIRSKTIGPRPMYPNVTVITTRVKAIGKPAQMPAMSAAIITAPRSSGLICSGVREAGVAVRTRRAFDARGEPEWIRGWPEKGASRSFRAGPPERGERAEELDDALEQEQRHRDHHHPLEGIERGAPGALDRLLADHPGVLGV